ncbi:MAG: phosphoribosylformylglycinamidine synthase [Clostridia bacterium]|nr:phosphoribosylformylglycinamidine synthase [Clostridia bacterium]
MVYRIYVEKKKEFAIEADGLLAEIKEFLQIESIEGVRMLNRYDVEGVAEHLFDNCKKTVFSEPQVDTLLEDIPQDFDACFAVEFLPGQFDQRADSAAQCIQIISQKERPLVKTAKVYLFYGRLMEEEVTKIKAYVINPIESREASLEGFDTLSVQYEVPTTVQTINGFCGFKTEELLSFSQDYGLAMDLADISLCQAYFQTEKRDPTITEIRMIDTYWSDHCRHTTFNTVLKNVEFEDPAIQKTYEEYIAIRKELNRTKDITLMDLATINARYLKSKGFLDKLDESKEVNACTVKIDVDVDDKKEKWLLLFKNETHNHPTEIEPFGGAATCVGGAIRDPLSGRAYVYAAMRLSGAGNPLEPIDNTMKGKLPQRKLVKTAAAGYSSYGNQIGVPAGRVDEWYHPGFVAKRMECGAVIGAVPEAHVVREEPIPGDVVLLLGGKTGRDGCGGATGSSKSHSTESLEVCGSEVQKGNAPEERKIQRLFLNKEATCLIKRCNDFGAGGVSVAVGELADGLRIDLNAIPKKYEGLDGTELAISESQERMAVVVSKESVDAFCAFASDENLEVSEIAVVTEAPRLVMVWNGKNIVDVSRAFLDTNGAQKTAAALVQKSSFVEKPFSGGFSDNLHQLVSDLNVCSKKGMVERFDASVGAGMVLSPFGGMHQCTPTQAMVHKVFDPARDIRTCSLMAWGYNPFISDNSPYHGAYLAVVESVSKLIAAGAKWKDIYLSFQEYFEKLGDAPLRWGKPLSALLGAFKAQSGLGIAAIGGKDSMSGTFEEISVPPTLVSFAVTTADIDAILSPEFKKAESNVYWIRPKNGEDGLPTAASLLKAYAYINKTAEAGKVLAAFTPGYGGVAEAVYKMAIGNGFGFSFSENLRLKELFGYSYGSFVLELSGEPEALPESVVCELLGKTLEKQEMTFGKERVGMEKLHEEYTEVMENIFPCKYSGATSKEKSSVKAYTFDARNRAFPAIKIAKPKVLIPAFPGTNSEYDSAKAMALAGAAPEIIVIKNLSSSDIESSVEYFAQQLSKAQMVFIPGGFSGGDEPDGSGKFITAFFRNQAVKEQTEKLLNERDGLMIGICNGFQALIKLGLVPYGKIIQTDENSPTVTFNAIGRHKATIIRTRIASNMSPWLSKTKVNDIHHVPISHGEGRFVCSPELIEELAKNGQIATQYVDMDGNPTMELPHNPNGSAYAVEGITSPDGRVFGKMGHFERTGYGTFRNVYGNYDMKLFEAAVDYFK